MDDAFDLRLRAAARELDEPLHVVDAYRRYLEVERTYRERLLSDRSAADLVGRLADVEQEPDDARREAGSDRSSAGRSDAEDLVTAAARGDRAAVGEVLRQVRPMIERYCRARTGRNPEDIDAVEDVVQEVCLAVLTALPSYRSRSSRSFAAFVYGVAQRTVVRPAPAPPEEPPDVDLAALDALPRRHRDVIVLRILAGLSAEETAYALQTTPGAVRVAQHRALRTLRRNPQDQRPR